MPRKLSPLCDLPFFSALVMLTLEFFLIDFKLLSIAGECHNGVASRFSENCVIQPLMGLFINEFFDSSIPLIILFIHPSSPSDIHSVFLYTRPKLPIYKEKIHVNWHINFHIFLLLYSIIPLSSLSKISLLSPFVLSSASSFFTHCAFSGFSGPCSCPTSVIVLPNWLAPLPSFTTSVWIFYMVGSLLSFSFFL